MNDTLTLEVTGMRRLDGEGKVKAFCDLSICESFLVRGFKVVEGKKGPFVGMPGRQGGDGKWYDTVRPLNEEVKERLNEIILSAYQDGNGEI